MIVIWKKKASKSLNGIFNYIAKDSENRAFDVVFKIREYTEALVLFPEKFEREHNIKGERNIRREIIYSYKIIYEVTTDAIFILDIFHTAQNTDKLNTL